MAVLVTGGAGFIGSHLVDRLMGDDREVKVVDDLSAGSMNNIKSWIDEKRFKFTHGNLLDPKVALSSVIGCDEVFHMAANPEVRATKSTPVDHFEQNIRVTFNLLEAVKKVGEVKTLVFASTSTVYGEAEQIPTPENYGPMKPISLYGASKLACEALISAYASLIDFNAVIYRLANVVGPRSNHGVTYDFVQKLRDSPDELEVLGDGSQSKSYLYIDDCVDGFLTGLKITDGVEVYNIGSNDRVKVMQIAEIVKEEMKLPNAKVRLTGGVDGGRGWAGDVKIMQLDTTKLSGDGWNPKYNSSEAIRLTAKWIAQH